MSAPLPFALRVVVCFLLAHAAKSAAQGAQAALALPAGGSLQDAVAPFALYIAFDLLLAVQIAVRGRGALFWGVVYFAALALLVVEPARWPAMSPLERLRELAAVGIDLAMLGALLTRSSRETLLA